MHLLGTHFGTYEVCEGTAGEPRLRPFRHDPAPSPVGAAYLDLARHPARVLGPMARQGWLEAPDRAPQDRGRDAFVRLDWETAARLFGISDAVLAEARRMRLARSGGG
mgnify:CR=1 FL=1